MTLRPMVGDLVDALASPEEKAAEQAILRAALLFEQTHLIESAHVVATQYRDDVGPDYEPARLDAIREQYRVLARLGLLPEDYAGVALAEEEKQALVRALVRLLTQPPHLAREAAEALSNSGCLDAAPALAEAALRDVQEDGSVAAAAVTGIAKILTRTLDDAGPRSPHEESIARAAVAALRAVARAGKDDPSDPARTPRADARAALKLIRRDLGWAASGGRVGG